MHNQQEITSVKKKKSIFTRALACLVAVIAVAIIPEVSFAAGGWCLSGGGSFSFAGISLSGGGSTGSGCASAAGGIASALCTIVDWFQAGGVGAAIASMAVIFMGIAAFFGKVTWGMALTTACGIFAIFGSGEIIESITNGAGTGCFI